MYQYSVKEVERVVDGDTVDVCIDLGFSICLKERIRLNGIDTPETNSTVAEEREIAQEAKEFVKRWFAAHPALVIETTKEDKYGRMLGEFFPLGSKVSLNRELVEAGLAWEYTGGTKSKDLSVLLERRRP